MLRCNLKYIINVVEKHSIWNFPLLLRKTAHNVTFNWTLSLNKSFNSGDFDEINLISSVRKLVSSYITRDHTIYYL